MFGSMLFLLHCITWMPIVVYVPSLAFNQVSGINIFVVASLMVFCCVFYTCIGGLKAVIWSDLLQIFIMLGAILIIAYKGTQDIGGLGVVLQRNLDSGRIGNVTDFSFDPTIRNTFWSLTIGSIFNWSAIIATDQSMIQRFLSLPNLKAAQKSLHFCVIGFIIILSLCIYNGLLAYATFYNCDPVSTELANAPDQVIPILVMQVLGGYPGLSGCFVAGVFSAALSSLSTGLNSTAAVILEDFFKPCMRKGLTERQTAIILRAVVVIFGILALALVFVVAKLGTVLQLSISVEAISFGPLFAVFTMGVCLPTIHAKGALIGGLSGILIMGWIVLKAQLNIATGELQFDKKPVSTEGCLYDFNNSSLINNATGPQEPQEKSIYQLSYLYYALCGFVITLTVGYVSTLIIGKQDPNLIDSSLLTPVIRKWRAEERRKSQEMAYTTYSFEPTKNNMDEDDY